LTRSAWDLSTSQSVRSLRMQYLFDIVHFSATHHIMSSDSRLSVG
jgi:hypothetical protein